MTAPLVMGSSLPGSSSQRLPPAELVAEAVETLKNAFLEYLEGNVVSSVCTLWLGSIYMILCTTVVCVFLCLAL